MRAGEAKGAEQVYRMTRGMNEAFLEKMVGDELTGQEGQSAAGVLQAATAQGIPLMYVDAERLEPLAAAAISEEAKARVVQAAQQGYGVMIPKRMVAWNEALTTAWWQIDLESGEVVGVGEDGAHQFLVTLPAEARLFAITVEGFLTVINLLKARLWAWERAANITWYHFWRRAVAEADDGARSIPEIYLEALKETKVYAREQWLDKSDSPGTVFDVCQALFGDVCERAR